MACVAMFLMVGCRDRETVQDRLDKVCVEAAELDAPVTRIASLDPGSFSVGRLTELRTDLETQYRELQEAAADEQSIRIDSVTQAYNNFLTSINGVRDQASLAEAEARIDRAAGEFSDARLQLHTTAGC